MPPLPRAPLHRRPLAWVVAAFVLSRGMAALLGVRFDAEAAAHVWHTLDRDLLRDRLWESLLHLHSQPPLFNMFLGLGYRLPDAWQAPAFHAIYAGLGLALAVGLYKLLVRLGAGERAAAVGAIAFSVSPAALLYEQWLHYTHPVVVAIALSALALHRALTAPTLGRWSVFFGLLAAAALTRSVYHLGWLALVALALALPLAGLDGPARRRMLMGALIPIALVFGVYAKNAALFHTFSASSWLGMNVQRITLGQTPPEVKQAMVASGVLSPLGTYAAFLPVDAYPPAWRGGPPTGVPALDRPTKADGQPNFNHRAYLGLSGQFQRDATALVRHRPVTYLKGVARAASWYVRPASDYGLLEPNRSRIGAWDTLWDKLVFGCWLKVAPSWPIAPPPEGAGTARKLFAEHRNVGFFVILGLPALWAFGARRALRRWRGDRAGSLTLAYMLATIAFVTVLGVALDVGENNRFRYDVDPLLAVLLTLAVPAAWARLRGRYGPSRR